MDIGEHHSVGGDPGCRGIAENKLNASPSVPACVQHGTNPFPLSLPRLPHHDGLHLER